MNLILAQLSFRRNGMERKAETNCEPDQLPGTVPWATLLEVEAARFLGREGVGGRRDRSG